jgi:hypothetical protein
MLPLELYLIRVTDTDGRSFVRPKDEDIFPGPSRF